MKTAIPTTEASAASKSATAQELASGITILLPPPLRALVDDVMGAAGLSFDEWAADYTGMICSDLLETVHKPELRPADEMLASFPIDDEKISAANLAACRHQSRLPQPR